MSALALLAAQALTLAEFDRLPPQAAADRALAGQEHGTIAAVLADPGNGMLAPGQVERGLVERPVPIADGCTRRRWTVSFGGRAGPPVQYSAYASMEVARRGGARCPTSGYAHVNTPLTAADSIAALARLDALRRDGEARLTCRDATPSGLCRDRRSIRAGLQLPAWAVTPQGGGVELWLGTPGDPITAVRFGAAGAPVAVSRYVPPPF